MKQLASAISAILSIFAITSCAAGSPESITLSGEKIKSEGDAPAADIAFCDAENNNPLISEIFCADPTAVEYNGRLYVYGTNDHQQFEAVGGNGENTYGHIKSLVMLSTDDMTNWTYHGNINVEEISPWIIASWAPSVTSRVEADGKTHFYMYYSNSGWGIGVLTAESPVGPWRDPLGKSIVDGNTKGLNGCKTPFDPGVVIDDNGVGWLSFGGGEDSARIVRLGEDMISFDSEIMPIPSLYHFEASELNYINGTYVYTYNNDWSNHIKTYNELGMAPACSMAYLTTKTPLVSDSWQYRDFYFKNPGDAGLEYSNNHTHLQKFGGKYYLFYHSLFPQKAQGIEGGFRSLCVNEANVDEENVSIERVEADKKGVSQIKKLDPFAVNQAETASAAKNISYSPTDTHGNQTVSSENGSFCVKGASFGKKAELFAVRAKGNGTISVYADRDASQCIASVKVSCSDFSAVYSPVKMSVSGEHDLYFCISGDIEFDEWQFTGSV